MSLRSRIVLIVTLAVAIWALGDHMLQRTLFLQFTLLDEGPRNASRP